MTYPIRILTIGADEADLVSLQNHFREGGVPQTSQSIESVDQLPTLLAMHEWDLLLAYHPKQRSSLDALLDITGRFGISCPIIVIADEDDCEQALRAVNAGIFRYIPAAVQDRHLFPSIQSAIEYSQVHQQLGLTETRYQMILEGQTEMVCRFLPGGILTYVNDAYSRFFGVDRGELVGRPYQDRLPLDDANLVLQSLEELTPDKPYKIIQNRVLGLDGSCRWTEWTNRAIFDGQGLIIEYQSVGRDITVQRQADEEIHRLNEGLEQAISARTAAFQESEERYRTVSELTSDFAYSLIVAPDGSIRVEWITDAFNRITGFSLQEFRDRGGILAFVHPEDLAEVQRHHARWLNGRTDSCEYRLRDRFGQFHWLRDRGKPVWSDPDRRIVRVYGTTQEITASKEAESAIRESEERYRTLFETMDQGVVYLDSQGKILAANPAAVQILGVRSEKITQLSTYDPAWNAVHEDGSPFHADEHPVMVALRTGQIVKNVAMGIFNPISQQVRWIRITAVPQYRPGEKKPNQVYAIFHDYTEWKKAGQALRESEERFRAVFESSTIGISMIGLDGTPLQYNTAFREMFGYSPEELANLRFSDVTHPDDLALNQALFAEVMEGKRDSFTLDKRYYRKNGEILWGRLNVSMVREAGGEPLFAISLVEDITQQKIAEESLRRTQEQLRRILRVSPVVICSISPEPPYWIRFISENFVRLYGYPEDLVYQETDFWQSRVHPDDLARFSQAISALTENEQEVVEYRFLNQTGEYRWIQGDFALHRGEAGNPDEILGTFVDITRRKMADDELRQALEKEKDLSELRTRFVSLASHEFRTPLSTILSSAELIEHYGAGWTEQKRIDHLHRIQAAVLTLTGMLDEILIIGRANAGKMPFILAPVNIVRLIEEVIEEMELSDRKNHSFNYQPPSDRPVILNDEKMLHIVITNLLSNSVKYSPENSQVLVTLAVRAGEIQIAVQDQGIGIAKVDLEHLGEPFHRGKNVAHIPGTGLGLTIVKNSLKRMGGRMEVTSEVGGGTCVRVMIPSSRP